MFNVYDKVWVMDNNVPKEKIIFAVIKSMDHYKTGESTHYRLVDSQVGAGWGNNEGWLCEEKYMFKTKEELINTL